MCTAVSDNSLFGRTLDLEFSYGESVVIAPREYRYRFIPNTSHNAIIGVAHVADGYPLFYDAVNEYGLAAAGLNFPGNAVYHDPIDYKYNLPSYEFIPWILCKCTSVDDAEKLIENTVITGDAFSSKYSPTPLHWIIADKFRSITVESVADGLKIYDNPLGVMTNNPPFPYHLLRITDYLNIGSAGRENTLCPGVSFEPYSRGMSGIGLPGDFSSSGRFVRAVFAKNHTAEDYDNSISRFFHIMGTVSIPKGCVKTDEGKEVYTVYTSCADLENHSYYFTTYSCQRISRVSLTIDAANGNNIRVFEMNTEEDIRIIDKKQN